MRIIYLYSSEVVYKHRDNHIIAQVIALMLVK